MRRSLSKYADLVPLLALLVADDDRHVLQILSDGLGAAGWRVDTFTDRAILLDAAHAEPPDVLVLDLLSDEAGGLELLARLRRDAALADIPVVTLLSPELTLGELERLERTAAALVRGCWRRKAASAQLLDSLLNGRELLPGRKPLEA